MRILVFGAGGYLGVPLCEKLYEKGHVVMAMDRFFFGKYPKVPLIFHADIRDFTMSPGLYDVVIDLSGLSNDATAEIDPTLTADINAEGGMHLAETAKAAGIKRYIYSSSASVYGHGAKTGLIETDPVNPLSHYADCKVQVENFIRGLDFESVILRNATVFGVAPRMRFDLAVNVMTMRAWKDKIIYVMGGGEQRRPFIHINDLVNIFVTIVELPSEKVSGQTFNVGYDAMNFSIGEIAQMVKYEFPHAQIHKIPDEPDKRNYDLSFKKLRVCTGMAFPMGIPMGIAEIRAALEMGTIRADDPTTVTLDWYKSLIQWEKRLGTLRLNGRIL